MKFPTLPALKTKTLKADVIRIDTEAQLMHPSEITILFVDDSRLVRAAAKKILSGTYQLIEAEDGLVAWETINNTNTIDLIISDLSMPNMGGIELIQNIRHSDDERIKTLPIIIASGADEDDGSKQSAQQAGANDFIAKPFNAKTLVSSIRQLTQTNETIKTVNFQSHNTQTTKELTEEEFLRQGEAHIAQAHRYHSELSLLKIEIDKYKVLFLRQGKAFIEALSKQVMELITSDLNTKHIAARTGLAEFSVLIPDADPISARHIAESIKCTIEKQAITIDGSSVQITVSAGLSCPVLRYDTQFKQLVAEASEKLAIAYGSGGNIIITASTNPLDPQKQRRTARSTINTSRNVGQTQHPLEKLSQISNDLFRADIDADQLLGKILPLLHHWSKQKSGLCQLEIQELENTLKKSADNAEEKPTQPA